jgi:hypothetical protein
MDDNFTVETLEDTFNRSSEGTESNSISLWDSDDWRTIPPYLSLETNGASRAFGSVVGQINYDVTEGKGVVTSESSASSSFIPSFLSLLEHEQNGSFDCHAAASTAHGPPTRASEECLYPPIQAATESRHAVPCFCLSSNSLIAVSDRDFNIERRLYWQPQRNTSTSPSDKQPYDQILDLCVRQ